MDKLVYSYTLHTQKGFHMKKFLGFVLVAVLVLGLVPPAHLADLQGRRLNGPLTEQSASLLPLLSWKAQSYELSLIVSVLPS